MQDSKVKALRLTFLCFLPQKSAINWLQGKQALNNNTSITARKRKPKIALFFKNPKYSTSRTCH